MNAAARALRLVAALAAPAFAARAADAGTVRNPAPAEIDAIFAAWDKPDSPGCALAVMHDGRLVYERGYGTADLEHGVPISPTTAFYVGSVSKQFSAMAIALLAQRGAITLDAGRVKNLRFAKR